MKQLFTKKRDEKGPETEALLTQAEDNSFEDEQLVGKYVRTDNRAYDFNAFYRNQKFMLRILGLPVEDVIMQPSRSEIIDIPINKAWFNGFATFVKLSVSSFKNLKTTLENKTGVWKDSIFVGKWFTDEEYERLHKAGDFNLKGVYILSEDRKLNFEAVTGPETTAIVFGDGHAGYREIQEIFGGTGMVIGVTNESFDNFKKNVLDKETPWTNVELANGRTIDNVEGTWRRRNTQGSQSSMSLPPPQSSAPLPTRTSNVGGGKPKRTRRPTHRKPTKRRRNRRGNRKTKKN